MDDNDIPTPLMATVKQLNDPTTHNFYANITHIVVNSSDVFIYFGLQGPESPLTDIKFDERIVLTHASFMKMMEYWASRYSVLKEVYGENPKSLADFDQSKVNQAFAEMFDRINGNPAEQPND